MAHFAKLLNNVVIAVVKVENAVLLDNNGVEQEQNGIDFLRSVYKEPLAEWKKTSYNTNGGVHSSGDPSKAFRKNYAAVGMIYDSVKDCFYSPKQYENWIFNEDVAAFYPPIKIPNNVTVMIDNIEIIFRDVQWNQEENRWENLHNSILYIWNPVSLTWEINTL
jgi:hypothetical protein